VKKQVLLAALLVICAGCYREPTHPAQMAENAKSQGGMPAGGMSGSMPMDAIHAGLGGGAAAGAGEIIESREVEIGDMTLTAPDDWVRKQPSSSFLLTEFALPKAEGDAEDGRLTVSTAGGTMEDNLARWKGQFSAKLDKEAEETIDVGDVKVSLVDYTGTYNAGMFGQSIPKEGYRMLAAVMPLEGQLFFIKGYGPEKTVTAHAEKIRAFINSLQPKQADASASGGTP
jgi:hypothetical protein